MRKNRLIPILAGIFMLGIIIYSCSKEKIPSISESLLQNNEFLMMKGLPKDVLLTPIEQLGKNLYFDKISIPNSMSCADCHAPIAGFTGPMAGINIHGSVYRGADAQNFGDRKPPSAAYATLSPILHYDSVEGLFIGGNFWDGRATGERLGNPAAEQALGPFLNPAEHNLPDALSVLEKIQKSKYIYLWNEVWGESFSTAADKIALNYDRIGLAIAAYEASGEINQFTSKYDYYLKGDVELTPEEAWGLELFNEKGMCVLCHMSEPGENGESPLFTDFTFDNLGVPKNPENPVYEYNPEFIDPGLGGFLATRNDYESYAEENMGKHKVPTLRNVDKKPGNGFTKAYTHNGVFKSLKEVVHFYNTRDVETWPAPEVSANVNSDELGNLGLTDAEENAIVAFLKTLSDGYVIK
jgi:cytochrome c peroxidase